MITDIKAVVSWLREQGDGERAMTVESAYFEYADNMTKAKPETICELEMPKVNRPPSPERVLLEPDSLAREVANLRNDVDALLADLRDRRTTESQI